MAPEYIQPFEGAEDRGPRRGGDRRRRHPTTMRLVTLKSEAQPSGKDQRPV